MSIRTPVFDLVVGPILNHLLAGPCPIGRPGDAMVDLLVTGLRTRS